MKHIILIIVSFTLLIGCVSESKYYSNNESLKHIIDSLEYRLEIDNQIMKNFFLDNIELKMINDENITPTIYPSKRLEEINQLIKEEKFNDAISHIHIMIGLYPKFSESAQNKLKELENNLYGIGNDSTYKTDPNATIKKAQQGRNKEL